MWSLKWTLNQFSRIADQPYENVRNENFILIIKLFDVISEWSSIASLYSESSSSLIIIQ